MKISGNLTCALSVCLLLFLSACSKDKKENSQPKNIYIFGSWYTKTGESSERHLNFGQNHEFELIDVDFKNGNISSVQYSGQYSLKGDSLKISISEKTVTKDNRLISQEPSDVKFYANSTYAVDGYSLMLNFKDNESRPVKTIFSMALPD